MYHNPRIFEEIDWGLWREKESDEKKKLERKREKKYIKKENLCLYIYKWLYDKKRKKKKGWSSEKKSAKEWLKMLNVEVGVIFSV